MRNIYFVEAGFSFDKDVYLPYATGTIAAYLKSKGCFDEKFNLAGFIYRREQTDSIIERLDNPYIVGFSCCIWNQQFNLTLAKKIKERFPECKIIFGGHNITSDSRFLHIYPFIDILVTGEGEKVFYDILCRIDSPELITTDNIIFRYKDNIVYTPFAPPPELDCLPSPYLTGIFSDILDKENHSNLLCILETTRGCPYSCSYCDWCAGKKVRKFPQEKIYAEIEWFARQKIEYCFCADSNFGIFERDVDIAAFIAETKAKYGYPAVFRSSFAKESNDNVFRISEILNKARMDKGATLAYQTLSEEALRNINRKNLTLEHFSTLLNKYNAAGIPTYSELILGLPGETKESFCNGICKILESGQHNSLSVYYLELLPNSEMSKKIFLHKHNIRSVQVEFNHMHSIKKQNEIAEYSNLVQSTATMSKEDWVYCNLFSVCVQCFHALGLLRYIALYLRYEQNISYYSFYSSLLEFILNEENTAANRLFSEFRSRLSSSLCGEWNYTNDELGEVSWAFEEGAYLELLKSYDSMLIELAPFFDSLFTNNDLLNELLHYQAASLRKPTQANQKHIFNYDFFTFFDSIYKNTPCALNKETAEYEFIVGKTYSDWKNFAKEIVWFGRRKGATIITGRQNSDTDIIKRII